MTALTTFIGPPDWRAALLAALFALPWLLLLARRRLRQPGLWAALLVAAALFPITIAWVQVPLQQALGNLLVRTLGADAVQRHIPILGLLVLLVASLVQESAKLIAAALGLALGRERGRPAAGLALGAAVGAGYGGFEAFWIFNLVLAQGWSWGVVQLVGPLALVPFLERLATVPFHIGAAALAAYGLTARRPGRFLLLAVALHTLANYAALLLQVGVLGIVACESWVVVVAAATIAAALWLRRRTATALAPDVPAAEGAAAAGQEPLP